MSVDLSTFNPAAVEDVSFSVIPKGTYVAMIVESESKESQTGNKYLNLKLQIVKGEYSGRTIFWRLNLWHSTPKTRQIAESQLKSIFNALGKSGAVKSTQELHDKPFEVVLKVKPDMNGEDRTEVSYVKAPRSAGGGSVASGAVAAKAVSATDDNVPF